MVKKVEIHLMLGEEGGDTSNDIEGEIDSV
jgi:hypothetical protein